MTNRSSWLQIALEFDIVHLEDGEGRARKPTIPYERIEAPAADNSDCAPCAGRISIMVS
jgi:hypothetical protein